MKRVTPLYVRGRFWKITSTYIFYQKGIKNSSVNFNKKFNYKKGVIVMENTKREREAVVFIRITWYGQTTLHPAPTLRDSAPFFPFVPSLCPFGPGKGDTTSEAPHPRYPTVPFRAHRWSGCPRRRAPAGEEVREFTSELTQASRDFRAAEQHGS